ncbi:MAG: beta-N-acetylhexosaminidase [Clostridia bacterium]|nr:beta-N-acetylhexosaminidase [Clostridia bacterium]
MEKKVISFMLDCSRNAIPNKAFLKKWIDILADCGYNELQLYTEDTLQVENEPYFGYLRGGFSVADIQELDGYCQSKGIELVPCIEVLAHLDRIFRWQEYAKINDCGGVLLVDEERTYAFLDNIFATVAQAFSSKKINLGMDETMLLGQGKYLAKHGYEEKSNIFLRHLGKVKTLTDKYGFQPMMWSDMFFRLDNNGEYARQSPALADETVAKKPQGIDLVYWDYNARSPEVFRDMLRAHKKFGKAPRWAGACWSFVGMLPHNDYAEAALKAAFPVMLEEGVNEFMLTWWGDDGAECPKLSNLPIVYAFAKMAQGDLDFEKIKLDFAKRYGVTWEDFNKIILPNRIDKQPLDVYNPAKYMLYNDYFSGIFDSTVAEGVGEKYAEYEKILSEFSTHTEYGYFFDCAAKLCAVLKEKYSLGAETRAAYQAQDKAAMNGLLQRYDRTLENLETFYTAFKKQWRTENTEHGLEVQAARIGGLIQRTKDCKERLEQWLAGEVERIEPLEEEILDFGGERPNEGKGLAVVYNSYQGNYSVNY